MKKKIALVCVAKEEDLYLQEWIDYHLKLGFDDIHIFQNEWRFNNPIPNERVHFHEWDVKTYHSKTDPIWVKNLQAKCYTDFSRSYHEEYEWAAFFDVDEFLVLKETNDVKEFIKNYDDHPCLIINWAIFCDNNIKTFDVNNTSLIKRFTKRWGDAHTDGGFQFKSICKLSGNMTHNTHWTNGVWVDPDFKKGNSVHNRNFNFNKAQLNHYYTKTYPEWIEKTKKSRCDTGVAGSLPIEVFGINNFNDIEDLYALNFLNSTL